jgi:hypothetical protein
MRRAAVPAALLGLLAAVALAGAAPAGAAARCDPLDQAACLLPFPNDHFTRADEDTATGRRLALHSDQMPRNKDGVPIDAEPYNASDGFSPGQIVVTKVPGLDTQAAFDRSGLVPQTDLARAYDEDQPVVVIDTHTRERHLIWAELDANATTDAARTLLVHPAVNWREGRRYVVALRRLRDADGRRLQPADAFRTFRDRLRDRSDAVRERRPHMEHVFRDLRRAGIERDDLYLAWDFTVASQDTLASRMLSIRDRAFAQLGDRDLDDLRVEGVAPAFRIDTVEELTPQQDANLVRRVQGTVTVPCFLDQRGCPPGSRFALDDRGLPVAPQGNTRDARLICLVPRSASPDRPARPLIYGHGLLGSAEEVRGLGVLAQASNAVICATDWTGFSREDLPNVVSILGDLSRFPSLPDRTQQGFLDFLFLGRVLIHPDGLGSDPAFQQGGRSLIDGSRLYYAGGSQGGILGGALTAIAPDFERAALIVPGMNYSLLLTRAVPFDAFSAVLYPAYPNELERPLILSLVQILWDRGEANGYAWHMTRDPYPDTPRHTVLLHEAFGDHQVANVATEVEARTIGARLRTPALDPGRSLDVEPFYGIRPIREDPYDGNALVVFDIGPLRAGGLGTPPAPAANLPPREGRDPHGVTPFALPAALQYFAFLQPDGAFVDSCGASPCYAAGWAGPGA